MGKGLSKDRIAWTTLSFQGTKPLPLVLLSNQRRNWWLKGIGSCWGTGPHLVQFSPLQLMTLKVLIELESTMNCDHINAEINTVSVYQVRRNRVHEICLWDLHHSLRVKHVKLSSLDHSIVIKKHSQICYLKILEGVRIDSSTNLWSKVVLEYRIVDIETWA